MKNSTVLILLAFALVTFTSFTKAQDSRFSIGLEAAFPMGTFGDYSSTGFGGSLRYEMPVGDAMGFTINAGYISFGGKDITVGGVTVEGESTGMIPVQLGLKYYFMEQQEGFYGQVLAGVHMWSVDEVEYDINTGASTTKSTLETKFSFAPEVGYHLANLDFGLRYQLFSATETSVDPVNFTVTEESTFYGYLGLRVAYVLGGK